MVYVCLLGAIVFELSGTLCLRMASTGKKLWFLPMGCCYALAFAALSAVISSGMPLGVAYGIWTALGVALAALLSWWIFKERITKVMLCGILLISLGVLLLELGTVHH